MIGKKTTKKRGQDQGYWQSYSDMMAALLLMFVLIMAFTLAQSLKSYEEKIKIQEEQQAILEEKQVLVLNQQAELEQQQSLLDEQQKLIDDLIGIKREIITDLSSAFKDSDLTIDIDAQTGDISLDSSILYAYDSDVLSRDGIDFLKEFLPLYISVLLDGPYRQYIAEIIIEGHTDTSGSYMYNLNLSQKRAYSVAAYCLDEKNSLLPMEHLEDLREIMTANGKSYSDPIYTPDGTVDANRSRRVEIKFRLQDEEMIHQMQEILEGN